MTAVAESDTKVTVERELVSQVEEEDMEALLGTYVLYFKLNMLPSAELVAASQTGHKLLFECSFNKWNKESITVPQSFYEELQL